MPKNNEYNKKPISYQCLISKLIDRGLHIDALDKAEKYLENIGYYRLIGYGLPFEQFHAGQRLGRYTNGTEFEHILNAYIVDRKIRILLLSAIERIEVTLRNTINHTLGCKYDSAHWFMDQTLFNTSARFSHTGLLKEIHRSAGKRITTGSNKEKQREIFIHHYYNNYDTPDYPPCWMVAEVLSLGSWSKVYEHLANSKDRKLISRRFDLPPATLQSWVHSLTFLRNICAHHGRLFGRKLPLPPSKDKSLPLQENNYVFNFICVIWYMLKTISPNSDWLDQLDDELERLTSDSNFYGFPKDWLDNQFWLE